MLVDAPRYHSGDFELSCGIGYLLRVFVWFVWSRFSLLGFFLVRCFVLLSFALLAPFGFWCLVSCFLGFVFGCLVHLTADWPGA